MASCFSGLSFGRNTIDAERDVVVFRAGTALFSSTELNARLLRVEVCLLDLVAFPNFVVRIDVLEFLARRGRKPYVEMRKPRWPNAKPFDRWDMWSGESW